MTEAEWLACADPKPMLEFLRGKASDRKLRLFACACVAQVLPLAKLLPGETSDALTEVERYGNGGTTKAAMKRVRERMAALRAKTPRNPRTTADDFVCYAIEYASQPTNFLKAVSYSSKLLPGGFWGGGVSAPPQSTLLRCIIGNPFRPSPPLPRSVLTWNDGTIPHIAQCIYDERQMPEGTLDTGRLAILHDALLDAGCTDEDLLTHCRSEGPHVRGCWAVDRLLGKE